MANQLASVDILGVRVDRVDMAQTVEIVEGMLKDQQQHLIVTPNVEFIMVAQKDLNFKKILNQSDLAIPDSARMGWASLMLKQKSRLKRLLLIPFVLFPKLISNFPVTTGVDLLEQLCRKAVEWGVTVGFIGGRAGVADEAAKCLKKKYSKLKVSFAEEGPEISPPGHPLTEPQDPVDMKMPPTDILFVAFGQVKQEEWIVNNLDNLPVKVAMGVGGAFDYLSGQIPRAPKSIRKLGFEWLYRLIIQPWRIKRQINLIKFVWMIAWS